MGVDHQTVIVFPDEENGTGVFTKAIRSLAFQHAKARGDHGSADRLLTQIAEHLAMPPGEDWERGAPVFSCGSRIGSSVRLMLTDTDDDAPVPALLPFLFDVLAKANRMFGAWGVCEQVRATILHSSDGGGPLDYRPWQTIVEAYLDDDPAGGPWLKINWIAGGGGLVAEDLRWRQVPAALLLPFSMLVVDGAFAPDRELPAAETLRLPGP